MESLYHETNKIFCARRMPLNSRPRKFSVFSFNIPTLSRNDMINVLYELSADFQTGHGQPAKPETTEPKRTRRSQERPERRTRKNQSNQRELKKPEDTEGNHQEPEGHQREKNRRGRKRGGAQKKYPRGVKKTLNFEWTFTPRG